MSNTTATKQRLAAKKQATTSTSSFKRFAPMLILLGVVFSFVTFCDKDDAPTATVTTATKATTTTNAIKKMPGIKLRELIEDQDLYITDLTDEQLVELAKQGCPEDDLHCKLVLGEILTALLARGYNIGELRINFYVLSCFDHNGQSVTRVLPFANYPNGPGQVFIWPEGMFEEGYNGKEIPQMDGIWCTTWAAFEKGSFVGFNDGAEEDLREILERDLKKWGLIPW